MGARTGARFSFAGRLLAATVTCAGAVLGLPAVADAAPGNWGTVRGCPVDHPAMLASPPGAVAACVDVGLGSPKGDEPIRLGGLKLKGVFRTTFGVHGPNWAAASVVPSTAPRVGSARIADLISAAEAAAKPCSLLPDSPFGSDSNTPAALCRTLVSGIETLVSVKIEPVGAPSSFSAAGATTGGAAMTVPVKFRLVSPILGAKCYIGSDAQPVVLHLRAARQAQFHEVRPDPNGFAVPHHFFYSLGGDPLDLYFQDSSFAVPAVKGCGAMDSVLNLLFGLPSPAGKNSFAMSRPMSVFSSAAGGAELSQAYHAALG